MMQLIRQLSIFVFFLLLLNSKGLFSQSVENSCDTLSIIAPAFLVFDDTSIHVLKDSTAIVCKKYIVVSQKNGYSIYSKLVGESNKHRLFDQLLRMIIVSSNQDTMLMKSHILEAEDAYKPYAGKTIRNIKIQVLKPFGASISDTNLPAITTWGKALNRSHIKTQDWIIRNKLMFKKYDKVIPYEMVENTNELTSLPYLQDADILINDAGTDSVDVVVLVKDKFPWLPQITIRNATNMTAYLTNVNILGMGHSLRLGSTFNTSSSPAVYLSDINYYNNNIFKQVSGEANFHIGDYDKLYQIKLYRNILPLSVRLGGGAEVSEQEENIVIDPTYTDKSLWYIKYRYYELWSSYLFYDKNDKLFNDFKHTFFIPGMGVYKTDYQYRPYPVVDTNSIYQDNTSILGNFAVVQQNYFRTNFLRDFGKAEYIPYGFQAVITGGYTWNQLFNSPYVGVGLSGTKHYNKIGYWFLNFQVGSHLNKGLEQGVLNLDLKYLSSLNVKNRYRMRYLVSLNYTSGINRITNDELYLGEDFNLVGIDEKTYYGRKRLYAEVMAITYTPWYFLGFRFALLGFVTGGILDHEDVPFFKNQLTSSIGVGVYCKNDFLAFDSFQMRVAYYPITRDGISNIGVSFTTLNFFDNINFLYTKPQIIEFR